MYIYIFELYIIYISLRTYFRPLIYIHDLKRQGCNKRTFLQNILKIRKERVKMLLWSNYIVLNIGTTRSKILRC